VGFKLSTGNYNLYSGSASSEVRQLVVKVASQSTSADEELL